MNLSNLKPAKGSVQSQVNVLVVDKAQVKVEQLLEVIKGQNHALDILER